MAIKTLNNRAINRSDTAASGQLWTATSATASDFQAAAAGGKVLQVITATDSTDREHSTAGWTTASNTLTVDITPASTSNKILVLCSLNINAAGDYGLTVFRDSTDISGLSSGVGFFRGGSTSRAGTFVCLDSPSSTSELTYQFKSYAIDSAVVRLNDDSATWSGGDSLSTLTCLEIDGT